MVLPSVPEIPYVTAQCSSKCVSKLAHKSGRSIVFLKIEGLDVVEASKVKGILTVDDDSCSLVTGVSDVEGGIVMLGCDCVDGIPGMNMD